jgi:hypothetical protein
MSGLASIILGPVMEVIDKVIPDADKKIELKLELAKLADAENNRSHEQMLAQIGVNKTEASHQSMFVAGWRPAIGWIGAVGLGYSFILEPIMSWTARVVFKYAGDFPALDTSSLMVLVTGMLGFGGLRTYEKYKGVAREESPSEPVAVEQPVKKKKKILGVAVPPWL